MFGIRARSAEKSGSLQGYRSQSNMPLKVAINGFGRIGRLVFRAGLKNPNIEFVGVNDLVPSDNLAYLLRHDTTHGKLDADVVAKEDGFTVNGKFVPTVSVRNPAELPWRQLG